MRLTKIAEGKIKYIGICNTCGEKLSVFNMHTCEACGVALCEYCVNFDTTDSEADFHESYCEGCLPE